jgi:putative ABC transport system ATP-binding protein
VLKGDGNVPRWAELFINTYDPSVCAGFGSPIITIHRANVTSPVRSDSGNTADTEVAQAYGLSKIYGVGPTAVTALDDVTVAFGRGQLTAIMGPSGSGKSTLMHCMAALDTPTSGRVVIDGVDTTRLKDKSLTKLRRDRLGFVFQAYNLIPTLTARENITLPLDIAGADLDQVWFDIVVDTLSIRDRLAHRPDQLSGGQQQRVACARALVSRPALVFADEPTGNLDSRASAEILAFLRKSVDEFGQSIVMVTHDPSAASYADRVVFLADGRIVDDVLAPTIQMVLARTQDLTFAGAGV